MNLDIGNRRCYLCLQNYILFFIFISFSLGLFLGILIVTRTDLEMSLNSILAPQPTKENKITLPRVTEYNYRVHPVSVSSLKKQLPNKKMVFTKQNLTSGISYNTHIFYYAWYGNPDFDGQYYHWNHRYLPHWSRTEVQRYRSGRHNPPDDIAANFYPADGCYSSHDPLIIASHMKQIQQSGIGIVVVSWYPPDMSDDEGFPPDPLMINLLSEAHKFGLKMTFHIEPFKGRTVKSLLVAIKYIINNYGSHPAFYQHQQGKRKLPLLYIYDSYLITSQNWSELLHPNGKLTIRGTFADAFVIALLVDQKHRTDIVKAGFDGFFTYFAANGFTYGSSWKNWKSLATFAYVNNLIFIPSLGPGYIDISVRPWNSQNSRNRRNGTYYETAFKSAIAAPAKFISITSFNEWHEGTQIEAAVPKSTKHITYLDYSPHDPDFYIHITKKMVTYFEKERKKHLRSA